jgi:hypothetical protein
MKSILNAAQTLLSPLFVTFGRTVRDMVREIFDEASYARFLRRAHMKSSPQAYAAFWRERDDGHARRPRCC